MAKIILARGDAVLREIALAKARVTIGRGRHNDIVIDDRAISAEHAVIVTGDNDAFLEDLNSTNGTMVNGQPIRKHFLQEGDVVELARYRILYLATDAGNEGDSGSPAPETPASPRRGEKGIALLKMLNGPEAGKEKVLAKALTTIGRPEARIAILARRADGYYLSSVEGEGGLSVNGQPLETDARKMTDEDVIDLGGVRMQFLAR